MIKLIKLVSLFLLLSLSFSQRNFFLDDEINNDSYELNTFRCFICKKYINKIKELEKIIDNQNSQIKSLNDNINRLQKDLESANKQINDLKEENNSLKEVINDLKNENQNLTDENKLLAKNLENANRQIDNLKGEIDLILYYLNAKVNIKQIELNKKTNQILRNDENSIFTSDEDGVIYLRELKTNRILNTLSIKNQNLILKLTTNKNKSFIFSVSDNIVVIYCFETLEYISTIQVDGKINSITDINSDSIAIAYDYKVSIYNILENRLISEYSHEEKEEIKDILSYKDNKFIVISNSYSFFTFENGIISKVFSSSIEKKYSKVYQLDSSKLVIIKNNQPDEFLIIDVGSYSEISSYSNLPDKTQINSILYLKNDFFIVLSSKYLRVFNYNNSLITLVRTIEILNDENTTQIIKNLDEEFIALSDYSTIDISIKGN